jgi:choline dehydrogenase-like flavoprotein
MKILDYIVVGSGCSGAMSAQTLVEAGKQVTMVDVGATNPKYHDMVPEKDFITLRKTDPEQYRYLLGSEIEGVSWAQIGKGAQITPARKHMYKHADTHLRMDSKNFFPIESLGYGGAGIGWGVQCWEYSDADMRMAGLDPQKMSQAYETVARRIGISGTNDGTGKYTLGTLKTYQPSPKMDRNHKYIMGKYDKHLKYFQKLGLHMGRTPLALLTKDKGNRKAYAYQDMDFYTDKHRSAWRPWIAVDELRKNNSFTYIGGYMVKTFKEKDDYVELVCVNVDTGKEESFYCRSLILGSGVLGTARIVLRSLGAKKRLPILCNPYTYIPCLQPAMVGKEAEPGKMGFAQLSLFLDENNDNVDTSVASLYSYQSLMMFRVIKQIPFLSFTDARVLMQWLMPGLVIMGVHHPDKHSDNKYMELVPDKHSATGDSLKVHYELGAEELAELDRREKKMVSAMRKTGTFALKRINPGYGASVHYAGTLPFSDEEKSFTLARNGRLHGTKKVFVADSSGFEYLPSRGVTFTLLANAHNVAEGVLAHGS